MKGKKLLAGVLAVGMTLSFTGCNTAKKKNDNSEVVTLKTYMIGSEKTDTKLVIEEVNKHLREKIGAELEWNILPGSMMQEKMNMIYAANEKFDLCFTGYANKLSEAVKNSSLLELSELMEEYAPDLKSKIPDYLWQVATVDGEIYAVPNQQINASQMTAQFFKSDIEKFGLDVSNVECNADLEPLLEKIKASGTDRIPYRGPFAQSLADKDTLDKYEVLNNGTALNKETMKVENLYETDFYISGMKRARDWYEKGYTRSDIATVVDDDADWLAKRYVVCNQNWKPSLDYDTAKWNSWFPDEEPVRVKVEKPYITTAKCDSTMYSISTNSKNPVKAIEYLDLINTDIEVYNLLCYGIENKHWEWTDENKTHVRQLTPDLYQPNAAWAYGNQFNSYVQEGMPEDIWEQEKALNLKAETSPILGLSFDNSNLTTEIAQLQTVLADYTMLDKGYGDWEKKHPEMLERLKKAGIEKVIAEYQAQVDKFLKNKK